MPWKQRIDFSNAHGTFTKLGPNLNTFHLVEMAETVFYNHNIIKLEIDKNLSRKF